MHPIVYFAVAWGMVQLCTRPSQRSGLSIRSERADEEGQQNRNPHRSIWHPAPMPAGWAPPGSFGRWQVAVEPPAGFTARPGVPAHALNPGECAQYLGGQGRWYVCCKSNDTDSNGNHTYSCFRLGTDSGPWSDPLWSRRGERPIKRNYFRPITGGIARTSGGLASTRRNDESLSFNYAKMRTRNQRACKA